MNETTPAAEGSSSISKPASQMGEHTPGPWRVKGVNANLVYAERGFVADVHGDTRGAWSGTGQANARLIAAAPELLEALRDAERAIVHLNGDVACEETLHGIRAAIAKATGAAS